MTDEIEEKALLYIKKVDEMGGAVRAIENKFYQMEIANSAYEYQKAIEKKGKIIIGVNNFITNEKFQPEIMKINQSVRDKQIERLTRLKKKRDASKVDSALKTLEQRAKNGDNLMPCILDAVEAYTTVGEISDALRSVWGEYKEI